MATQISNRWHTSDRKHTHSPTLAHTNRNRRKVNDRVKETYSMLFNYSQTLDEKPNDVIAPAHAPHTHTHTPYTHDMPNEKH